MAESYRSKLGRASSKPINSNGTVNDQSRSSFVEPKKVPQKPLSIKEKLAMASDRPAPTVQKSVERRSQVQKPVQRPVEKPVQKVEKPVERPKPVVPEVQKPVEKKTPPAPKVENKVVKEEPPKIEKKPEPEEKEDSAKDAFYRMLNQRKKEQEQQQQEEKKREEEKKEDSPSEEKEEDDEDDHEPEDGFKLVNLYGMNIEVCDATQDPSEKRDVEVLMKEAETCFPERWMETYNKAQSSRKHDYKTLKIKKGRFRYAEDGLLIILPDMNTSGISSKQMLGEKWM